MPRVICDLPNASDEISGVKFFPLEDGGLISDEISDEQAELFASIPGYTIDGEGAEPVKKAEPKPAPTTRKAAKAPAKPAAPVEPPPAAPAEGEQTGGAGEGDGEPTVF